VLIVVSAFVAVAVNMSSMNLIGKTSAVSYQVVGHAKTCLILASGFVFVNDSFDLSWQQLKNLGGVGIGLLGVFAYSYYKLNENKK
jgi:solute carrier family 35 protein E3